MSMSYTTTTTFTKTHAKHLAAKVITDLYQCNLLYGYPTEASISDYLTELIELLAGNFVKTYEFGFRKNGERVVAWRYSVSADGELHGGDANAGNLYARAPVAGAEYYNHLTYSDHWLDVGDAEREAVQDRLPFRRTTASLLGDGDGYWQTDHGYTAGGRRIERTTFRPS
jgi:Bacterial HORMA domain family 1